MCLPMWGSSIWAKTAYVVYDKSKRTLTFRYDNAMPTEYAYLLPENFETPRWIYSYCNYISKVVFDASFAEARPKTCFRWFNECTSLEKIEGFEYLNTENVTIMNLMFNGCSKLTSLDLSNFNTEKVSTMTGMFEGCSKLTSLNLSNFNTENVSEIDDMFHGCSALTSLDLSNFNTENVSDMSGMFFRCSALTSLDLSSFNTEKVSDMNSMFYGCSALTSLDLSSFNTEKVEMMANMFDGCSALTTIYTSNKFVTTKISNIYYGNYMFLGCTSLKGAMPSYEASKTDKNYANYETGYFTKLVVRNGDERFGITGKTTEQITVDNLALDDNKDLVFYEPFTATSATYNRNIKAGATWATLCLPFDVSLNEQNFRAFLLLSAKENTIELKEIETASIAAGTPVFVRMNNGETKIKLSVANVNIKDNASTTTTEDGNYKLSGLYTKKKFSKAKDTNCYILKNSKLMNPAKLLENTANKAVYSQPFRAYMVDCSPAPAAGAKMFDIAVGGSTTAIDYLNAIADDKAEYYNLQGHRLNAMQKGMNIVKRGNKTMKIIIK